MTTNKQAARSVSPFRLRPNGAPEGATEHNTKERAGALIEQHQAGDITLRKLYGMLRELLGEDVFEGTRHCWENMKQRTKDGYATLDPRFDTFPSFLSHMGPRPFKDASIHRKNNDKGYTPENCEWADKITQSRERTNTVTLTCEGETLPLTEWAERVGISASTLRRRRAQGWNDHDVIHGKAEAGSIRVPEDAPWPKNTREGWEARFQKAGGKTHSQRLEYLRKRTGARLSVIAERGMQLGYDPDDESYTPTPAQIEELGKLNEQYNEVDYFYQLARRELQAIKEAAEEKAKRRFEIDFKR